MMAALTHLLVNLVAYKEHDGSIDSFVGQFGCI